MIQRNRWICTGVLFGCTALGAAFSLTGESLCHALMLGSLTAFVLVLPSFWGLSWALLKSDKIFYTVFAAGFIMRLMLLTLISWLVFRYFRSSLVGFLITAVSLFVVFSLIEAYFISRQSQLNRG